jgi:hypothetical protein
LNTSWKRSCKRRGFLLVIQFFKKLCVQHMISYQLEQVSRTFFCIYLIVNVHPYGKKCMKMKTNQIDHKMKSSSWNYERIISLIMLVKKMWTMCNCDEKCFSHKFYLLVLSFKYMPSLFRFQHSLIVMLLISCSNYIF